PSYYSLNFLCQDSLSPEIYTLSLHDALPISTSYVRGIFHSSDGAFVKLTVNRSWVSETLPLGSRFTFTIGNPGCSVQPAAISPRSEEHTSELQSLAYLVCRLLLEKKKKKKNY